MEPQQPSWLLGRQLQQVQQVLPVPLSQALHSPRSCMRWQLVNTV